MNSLPHTDQVVAKTGVVYKPSKHVQGLLCHPEVDNLLTNPATKQRVAAPRRPKQVYIEPRVHSLNEGFHRVLVKLASEFKKEEWQPLVDDETGLSINFVGGGASRIRSVAGIKKLPVGTPIDSNEEIRSKIRESLAKEGRKLFDQPIDDREIELFDWMCQCLMGTLVYGSASLRKEASTMLPDFLGGRKSPDGDIPAKKEYIEKMYKFIKGRQNEWIEPREWQAAGFYLGYLCVERMQADTFEKDRFSNTGVGLVKVDRLLAEMPEFRLLPLARELAGMRVRTAYGASGTISYALTVAATPMRNGMFENYGFTYKHRTPKEVSAKINKFKAVLGVDVTQYDQSIAAFWLERYCLNLEKFGPFSKALASLHYYHLSAYALAPCPYSELGHQWVAVGTVFDKKGYSFERGLPSGTPLNPDIGKAIQTFEILSRARRAGVVKIESIQDVDMILRGHNSKFAFLNSSDDTLLLGDSRETLKKLISCDGYLQWDIEAVPSFLGTVYGGKPGQVIGYPNIMSYFNRRLNPEQGIGFKEGDHRYYWKTGFAAQDLHYGVHPMFSKAVKLLDTLWLEEFGYEFTATYRAPGHEHKLTVSMLSMNEVDRLVMIKPEAIHYMVDEKDVSPEVLAMTMASVPEEDVRRLCQVFYAPTSTTQ